MKSAKTHAKESEKHTKFIDEKLNTKSLMFFVSFFSCDLYDHYYQISICEPQSICLAQASCTELTLKSINLEEGINVDRVQKLYKLLNEIHTKIKKYEGESF